MTIELGGVPIDLKQDLDFNFELNDQQINALNVVVEFIESKQQCCTIQGSAGVGKTTIVKIIMHYLDMHTSRMYLLCAPTHKAKTVLQKLSNNTAETLHSVLNLKPNFDIEKFDARELDFLVDDYSSMKKRKAVIPYKGLLIIDEASMINNDLYRLILTKAKDNDCKVLFIGDIAQLQPVKQGDISLVFQEKDDYNIKLTKVERQKGDNPLLDVLTKLRDESLYEFETVINNEIGIDVSNDLREFCSKLVGNISPESIRIDPYKHRVLCYTNRRVAEFNKFIRKALKYDHKEIVVGELLMAYDGVTKKDIPIISNSSDYVVESIQDTVINIPEYGNVPGYRLILRDMNEQNFANIMKTLYVLRNDLEDYVYNSLAYTMESFREKAIKAKKQGFKYAGMFWRKFYEMNEAIQCFRDLVYDNRVIKKKCIGYGYAHTIHKSQGATYENIWVDMKNVMGCQDSNELRQLQYVALSRARKKAFLLT